jgi:tRNA pseudouridine32 synthase/23S rRNA pseudouridine746 synthase
MDTSGLLLVALDPESQRALSEQFRLRTVEKRYTALVSGILKSENGTISLPVRPDIARRPYQVVDLDHHRPAVTAWRVLSLETDRTRVELFPLTGRTHQLRVHCAYPGPGGLGADAMGHPIIGDVLYGTPAEAACEPQRLMLHASFLSFTDPATGRRVELRSAAPF